MEYYSHPDIHSIVNIEGNSECVDCSAPDPKWVSMNNGVFLCFQCAGIHRGLGMDISDIRSLQIDSWSKSQLLYLIKGGNNNFKKHLSEFNIDPLSASIEEKYKSKAALYYRNFLKNEIEKECDSNYIPNEITKPDIIEAKEIVEEEIEEEKDINEEKENNDNKKVKKNFFGFMSNVFNKVKRGSMEAAHNVKKGLKKLKIGKKLKGTGKAIAGATKKGVQKTKLFFKRDHQPQEKEETRINVNIRQKVNEENSENIKDIREDSKEENKNVVNDKIIVNENKNIPDENIQVDS